MFDDCYTRTKEILSAPPLPFYLFPSERNGCSEAKPPKWEA